MRKIIFILILFGLCHAGAAQVIYFNKTYPYNHTGTYGLSVVVAKDSSYMLCGYENIPSPGKGNKVLIKKVNKKGDSVFTKTFVVSSNSTAINCSANNIFQYKNGYKLTGILNHYDSKYILDNSNAFIYKIDSLGDTISFKTYGPDTSLFITINSVAIKTTDGGYALSGLEFDTAYYTPYSNMFMVKTDSVGKEKFETQISGGYLSAASITETKDKGFTLIGAHLFPGAINYYTMVIARVDSTGHLKWKREYDSSSTPEAQGWDILSTKDGGFLALGFKELAWFTPGVYFTKPWLLKLDSAGNIQWQKVYGDTLFGFDVNNMRLIQTHDSNYVIMGNTGYLRTPPAFFSFILKVKPNGDSLWWYAFPSDQSDFINDIKETPDHGFILCGNKYVVTDSINDTLKYSTMEIWLIKTDSLGCDVAGCNITGTEEITPHTRGTLAIYPNPTTGSFTLNYKLPVNTQEATLHITTLLGEEVKTYPIPARGNKYTIEGLNLAEGMYICQLYADDILAGSTRVVAVK